MKIKAYAVIDADTNEFHTNLSGISATYFTNEFAHATLYVAPKSAQRKAGIPRNRKIDSGEIVPRNLKVVRVTMDVKLEDLE